MQQIDDEPPLTITLKFKGHDKPIVLAMLDEVTPYERYTLSFDVPDRDGKIGHKLTSDQHRVRRIL